MGNKENPNNNGIPESDIVSGDRIFKSIKKKTILLFMQPYTPLRLHELFF